MALDRNEAPDGCIAIESGPNICTGCMFFALGWKCMLDAPVFCVASRRKDGTEVIFTPATTKATAGWPYDSEGTPVDL